MATVTFSSASSRASSASHAGAPWDWASPPGCMPSVVPGDRSSWIRRAANSRPDPGSPSIMSRNAALRQRRQDIPELAHAVLQAEGSTVRISRRATIALTSYAWPGNVAQLRRVVLAAARACRGTEIRAEHLGAEIFASAHGRRTLTRLESLERDAIVDAMRESGGNKIQTAAALGMSRSTLYRRLRMYGLEPGRTVL